MKTSDDDEGDNNEDDTLSALFTCETYTEKTFDFGDIKQSLLCSRATSTDFDLTGQIVWPASIILCWYLAHHRLDLLENKTVLELGAGCGLAGFYAAKFCSHTTITDGNEVVLRLLEQNKQFLLDKEVTMEIGKPAKNKVEVKKLLWGIKDEIRAIYCNENSTSSSSSSSIPTPSIIIGADIILWPLSVLPLVHTLRWLLSFNAETSRAIISYVVRANSTTELLLEMASAYGLDIETIRTHDQFLPNPMPENLVGLEKIVFCIKIAQPIGVTFETEPEEYPGISQGDTAPNDMLFAYSTRTAAC